MIVQGTSATLYFMTIQNGTDTVDLTDSTITISLQLPDSKIIIQKPVEIANAATGRCKVNLSPSDLPEGGTYCFQLVITSPSGAVSKSPVSTFYVVDSL